VKWWILAGQLNLLVVCRRESPGQVRASTIRRLDLVLPVLYQRLPSRSADLQFRVWLLGHAGVPAAVRALILYFKVHRQVPVETDKQNAFQITNDSGVEMASQAVTSNYSTTASLQQAKGHAFSTNPTSWAERGSITS